MKRAEAEHILQNMASATDDQRIAAGKYFRQRQRAFLSRAHTNACQMANAARIGYIPARDTQKAILLGLDLTSEEVSVFGKVFPELEPAWTEMQTDIAGLRKIYQGETPVFEGDPPLTWE